jgi:microcystin-dependent protein
VDAPGTDKFYGTDGTGVRGWRSSALPSVAKSIVLNSGAVELANDQTTPGNEKYYGTDNLGAKGYFPLPTPVIPAAIPTGTIVMFNSVSAPTGWAVCDGSNGTPDLRGRFILSTGQNINPAAGDINPSYSIGNFGGENMHQLHYNELPKHSHRTPVYRVDGVGSGSSVAGGSGSIIAEAVFTSNNEVYDDHDTPSEGLYSKHENRPPYYALTFIMKL